MRFALIIKKMKCPNLDIQQMDLPQCSQCLLPQELQESKEAYQLPVTSDNHIIA